ncbi:hypothetical protein [Aquipuribacter hungaricus]|uniref:DUF4190 domain-containing protein n=1 Tax=Aquipuribacter hungaricus TaxID=545624 RepID=A0ABV7WC34_9MICO
MSDHDDRPQDDAGASRASDSQDSVLGGFSWDDPGQTPASAGSGRAGSSAVGGDATPAAYPPAAPYPPAQPPAAPSSSSSDDPYGTGSPSRVPLTKPGASQPAPPSDASGYAGSPSAGSPYAAPEQGYGQPGVSHPYGQQQPYGQGYGQSAQYTSTPQPYAYGPPPLSPEAEKVRSSAILWTVLNGVAIFLCGNLLSIVGVILAAVAIGKTRDDVQGARSFVRWSWILLAVGFAFWLLLIIGYVVFIIVLGLGTAGLGSGF